MRFRTCLALIVVTLVLVPASPAQEAQAPPPVTVTSLTGPLHLIECADNVHMLASIGEDGTLLVDTGYGQTAEAAREALAELGGGAPRIIVNSHGDPDHVGGNAVLGETAVIIAHPAVRDQMGSYFALPALDTTGLPTLTLDREASLYFNGDSIRLLPIPGGHTAGDVVVHFTGSKVAFLGDLVLTDTFPDAGPDRGGDAQRLAEVLRELAELLPADTTFVPGHGANLDLDGLNAYITMVEETTAAVAKEMQAGLSLDEILEKGSLAPWAEWERPEDGLSYADWGGEIYASLSGRSRQSICAPVTEVLVEDGIEAAAALYMKLKIEQPEEWSFAENELNGLGYQLLFRNMVDEAIVIFELNVQSYPNGFNAHDSLGEAYMTAGRTELAIASYERSLELNPENDNAVAMLARLRGGNV